MKPILPNTRLKLGKYGEDLASHYLSQKGYTIVDRNYRAGYGELDVVAIYQNILIFVEVKTRLGDDYGLPEESVTPRKLKEVIHTAEYYKSVHKDFPEQMRVDVIGIILAPDGTISYLKHIENAGF